jgi:hypothetical protein
MIVMDKEEIESDEIALLTRKERDWLLGILIDHTPTKKSPNIALLTK